MDLVERLRNPQGNDLLVTHDAADEIERLRQRDKDWQSAASEAATTAQGVIDELRKERDEHWEVRKKRGSLIDSLQVQLITCQNERDDFERKWLNEMKVPEVLELKKRIAVLENDAKYEGDENERRTKRFRAEIEDMCKRIADFKDQNHELSVQMADISFANMRANNFINDIFAALRDEPYSGYGREKVMQMIRNWYAESDGE